MSEPVAEAARANVPPGRTVLLNGWSVKDGTPTAVPETATEPAAMVVEPAELVRTTV